MTLKNIKTKDRGFTLVELLIVIVVIAILAAITLVAYNGIQTRARVSTAQANVEILQKKVEAYQAVKNVYPSTTATTDLNSQTESNLGGSITISSTPTATTGQTAFKLELCSAPANATGYKITYWDYNNNNLPGTAQITGGKNSTACTTYATAT